MTSHEIRFQLEKRLLELAVTIRGVHLVFAEGNSVSIIYDVTPDACGSGLHFEFEMPVALTREELGDFSAWLAWSDYGGTVH